MGSSQYVELHYSKKLLALTEEPPEQKKQFKQFKI